MKNVLSMPSLLLLLMAFAAIGALANNNDTRLQDLPMQVLAKIIIYSLATEQTKPAQQYQLQVWRSLNRESREITEKLPLHFRGWKYKIHRACYHNDPDTRRSWLLFHSDALLIRGVRFGDKCHRAILSALNPRRYGINHSSAHIQPIIRGLFWDQPEPILEESLAFGSIFLLVHRTLHSLKIGANFFTPVPGEELPHMNRLNLLNRQICPSLLRLDPTKMRWIELNFESVRQLSCRPLNYHSNLASTDESLFLQQIIERLPELRTLQLINLPADIDWPQQLYSGIMRSAPPIFRESNLEQLNLLWNNPLRDDQVGLLNEILFHLSPSLQVLSLSGDRSAQMLQRFITQKPEKTVASGDNDIRAPILQLSILIVTDPTWDDQQFGEAAIHALSRLPKMKFLQLPPMHPSDKIWWKRYFGGDDSRNRAYQATTSATVNIRQFELLNFQLKRFTDVNTVWQAALPAVNCIVPSTSDNAHSALWDLETALGPSFSFIKFLDWNRVIVASNVLLHMIVEEIPDGPWLDSVTLIKNIGVSVGPVRKLAVHLPRFHALEKLHLEIVPFAALAAAGPEDLWQHQVMLDLIINAKHLKQLHIHFLPIPWLNNGDGSIDHRFMSDMLPDDVIFSAVHALMETESDLNTLNLQFPKISADRFSSTPSLIREYADARFRGDDNDKNYDFSDDNYDDSDDDDDDETLLEVLMELLQRTKLRVFQVTIGDQIVIHWSSKVD